MFSTSSNVDSRCLGGVPSLSTDGSDLGAQEAAASTPALRSHAVSVASCGLNTRGSCGQVFLWRMALLATEGPAAQHACMRLAHEARVRLDSESVATAVSLKLSSSIPINSWLKLTWGKGACGPGVAELNVLAPTH